jgi:hypothetical protein
VPPSLTPLHSGTLLNIQEPSIDYLSLFCTFRKIVNTLQNKKNLTLFLIFYTNGLIIFQSDIGLRHFNMFKILLKKLLLVVQLYCSQ